MFTIHLFLILLIFCCSLIQLMQDAAEKRRQLEREHEAAIRGLREKQEEIRRLQEVCNTPVRPISLCMHIGHVHLSDQTITAVSP